MKKEWFWYLKQMFFMYKHVKMYVHIKKIKVSYSLLSLCNLLRGLSMTKRHIGTTTNALPLDTEKRKIPEKT